MRALLALLLSACVTPADVPIVGAMVKGVPGAIWADLDADGYADGCVRDGLYYRGRCDQWAWP